MKRCLAFRCRAFFAAGWLPLLPLALGLLLGLEAAGALNALLRRTGAADARTALALAADVRHLFPLAGAAWSAAYFGRELDGGARKLLRSRGFGSSAVYASAYFPFLAGALAISLTEQAVVLQAVPGRETLGAALLLRSAGLRLPLDLGMLTLPGFLPFLGKGSPYARFSGFLYGFALWRLMGSHAALWLPVLGPPDPWAFWPLAALPAGILGYFALTLNRSE